MEISITKEMLLQAVGTAAAKDGLTTLVTEAVAKNMSDYFSREFYGQTAFESTLKKFVEQVAVDCLEQKRPEITAYVSERIGALLEEAKAAAAKKMMERIRSAIT